MTDREIELKIASAMSEFKSDVMVQRLDDERSERRTAIENVHGEIEKVRDQCRAGFSRATGISLAVFGVVVTFVSILAWLKLDMVVTELVRVKVEKLSSESLEERAKRAAESAERSATGAADIKVELGNIRDAYKDSLDAAAALVKRSGRSWAECDWKGVGSAIANGRDQPWCADGWIPVQLDLDHNANPSDSPTIAAARCCRP